MLLSKICIRINNALKPWYSSGYMHVQDRIVM